MCIPKSSIHNSKYKNCYLNAFYFEQTQHYSPADIPLQIPSDATLFVQENGIREKEKSNKWA